MSIGRERVKPAARSRVLIVIIMKPIYSQNAVPLVNKVKEVVQHTLHSYVLCVYLHLNRCSIFVKGPETYWTWTEGNLEQKKHF